MQKEEQLVANEESETLSLNEVSEKTDTKTYPMDTNPIEVRINLSPNPAKKGFATHVLRKPSFAEEAAREREMALITTDAGKVEGNDASSMALEDESANIKLYDKIIISVSGYALNPGEKPSEGVLPDQTVSTPKGEFTVRELIPAGHKNTVIRDGLFPSTFELELGEDDGEEFVFALGGGREWVVRQDIGGKIKQQDGTLSPPDYVVRYTLRDPSEFERKKYRSKSVNSLTLRNPKTQEIFERRSTNLETIKELFDSMIIAVEGATVGGVPLVASDKKHVEQIPASFKKGCVIRVFNALDAELGN